MYRVITRFMDERGKLITERGPWLPSRVDAQYWADTFRSLGYQTAVEDQRAYLHLDGDDDLADTLSGLV